MSSCKFISAQWLLLYIFLHSFPSKLHGADTLSLDLFCVCVCVVFFNSELDALTFMTCSPAQLVSVAWCIGADFPDEKWPPTLLLLYARSIYGIAGPNQIWCAVSAVACWKRSVESAWRAGATLPQWSCCWRNGAQWSLCYCLAR